MLVKPLLVDGLSGKVGGVVAAHNRGGYYMRTFAVPSNNTFSPFRQAVRAALGSLSTRWSQVLNNTQRQSWTDYANRSPLINRLGDARLINGVAMYVRCNTPRLQAGMSGPIDSAPDSLAGDSGIDVITGVSAIAPVADISVDTGGGTQAWAITGDGGLLVYCSPGVQASLNFYSGPLRLQGFIPGDTPPTSPTGTIVVTGNLTWSAGQRVFWRVFASAGNGQLTPVHKGSVIVA